MVLRAGMSLLQGRLLVEPSEKMSLMVLLYYMSLPAGVFLLLAMLASKEVVTSERAMVLGLWVLSDINAWLLDVSNFMATSYTGLVALQVICNANICVSILS